MFEEDNVATADYQTGRQRIHQTRLAHSPTLWADPKLELA